MIVTSFLSWMDKAGSYERAEAVDLFARAFLNGAMGGEDAAAVEAALAVALDDESPMVRRALAIAFSESEAAPRHVVLTLAQDQPEVAGLLIARSPLLQEADLIELATTSEGLSLLAIALRVEVSERVCARLLTRAEPDVALALLRNARADLTEAQLASLVAAFGTRADIREALLKRGGLSASLRHALMLAVASSLGQFAVDGGFVNPVRNARTLDETIQTATLDIAAQQQGDIANLVVHLRETARLTPALLLRSVLGGNLLLLAHAVAELADMEPTRVFALMRGRSDPALAALFRRAGLPEFLENPLIAAVRAAEAGESEALISGFSIPVIRAVQAACLDVPGDEGVRLLALLRRYEAEAMRLEARKHGEALRAKTREEKERCLSVAMRTTARLGLPPSSLHRQGLPRSRQPEVHQAQAAAPTNDTAPDLRSIINIWKQEREARRRALSRPAADDPQAGHELENAASAGAVTQSFMQVRRYVA